jgi:dCMP deaminase
LIIQAGIKRVVFTENYRLEDGINLLKRAKIDAVQIDTDLLIELQDEK